MIGKTLDHYEITAAIGRGGMGEVYRAVDTRLGREVAVKVLPETVAQDPERLARFEREARTLASLHHPNVASLFGFEKAEGVRFLVMELVEGEDLAQRLARGPLPLDETLALVSEVARGLETAHGKGIVHRDLKPANIKITPDGHAKILDFGLARAYADESSSEDPALSPTITAAMTQAGTVIGTAAYMSPEQAKGRTADRQSDVFALGCVLYESLTGRQAFAGEAITEVLASVLRAEPDWSALPAQTPANVRRTIQRCLEKDPHDRLRDVGDVELLLRDLADEPAAPVPATGRRRWVWPALTSLLAVALLGTFLRGGPGSGPSPVTAPLTRMSQLTDLPGLQLHPSLSPDGRQLLYAARDGGDFDVFLQRVGGENPVNLTANSPDQDMQPAFSSDGERIAFVSDRQGGGIFVMGATGETPRRVVDRGFDPDWSPDGTQLVYTEELVVDPYSRSGLANIWVVDLEGGATRRLDDIDAAGPSWSPSGGRIAFWTHLETIQGQRDLWTIPAEGGAPSPVLIDIHTDWDPVWSADGGSLVFVSDRGGSPDLWRIAIDEQTGEAQGEPQPVTAGMTSIVQLSPIRSGRTAVVSQERRGAILRAGFDVDAERLTGQPETLHASAHPLWQMSISPDGEWLTFGTVSPTERLYMMSVDGEVRRKLIDDENRNRGLEIAPDGRWATYYSNRDGGYDVWAVRTDGTGARNLSSDPQIDINDPTWTSEGRLFAVVYTGVIRTVEFELPPGGLDAVSSTLDYDVLPGAEGFSGQAWSPDGRWIVGATSPEFGKALYSIPDGSVERLTRDGKPVFVDMWGTWLDAHRILAWDRSRSEAVVFDLRTGEYRSVPDIPGPSHYALSQDRRTLFVNHTDESSDVWLLELGEME